ncbi:uncharacterized protein LOC113313014 [Papaver somniferum]|uniref:uncharacterized protein LOC113313014 n=1 Tax=Papaver somniferum TaxID=3469 RepID=UPI000E6F8379|nr:uncharacterized protein LOC113313014 [Papaver somniferum]
MIAGDEELASDGEGIIASDEDLFSDGEEMVDSDGEMLSYPILQETRELKNEERVAVYQFLLRKSVNGKLKRGSYKIAARIFKTSYWTVQRIWQRAKENQDPNMPIDVSSRKPIRVRRKRIQIDPDKVLGVPLRKRTNIRVFAAAMGLSKSTLHLRVKEGKLKPHTSSMRPRLTDEGKQKRLRYCIKMLDTIARPRFDSFGNVLFDGKIGIWPRVRLVPAVRSSKNRKAGTLETKPIDPVDRKVSLEFLTQKVLPAIRAKWPTSNTRTIYIQQDNAKPHVLKDDPVFKQAAAIDGFDIRLKTQPPNSPDLNTLDLGYFNGIQGIQHIAAPSNIDELIAAVTDAYNSMSAHTLNKVFLTHQLCMEEVLKRRGDNNYELTHIGKDRLERQGNLPLCIQVDKGLVHDVLVERNMMPEFWSTLEQSVEGSQ